MENKFILKKVIIGALVFAISFIVFEECLVLDAHGAFLLTYLLIPSVVLSHWFGIEDPGHAGTWSRWQHFYFVANAALWAIPFAILFWDTMVNFWNTNGTRRSNNQKILKRVLLFSFIFSSAVFAAKEFMQTAQDARWQVMQLFILAPIAIISWMFGNKNLFQTKLFSQWVHCGLAANAFLWAIPFAAIYWKILSVIARKNE